MEIIYCFYFSVLKSNRNFQMRFIPLLKAQAFHPFPLQVKFLCAFLQHKIRQPNSSSSTSPSFTADISAAKMWYRKKALHSVNGPKAVNILLWKKFLLFVLGKSKERKIFGFIKKAKEGFPFGAEGAWGWK